MRMGMVAYLYPLEEKALEERGVLTYSTDCGTGNWTMKIENLPKYVAAQFVSASQDVKGFRTAPLNPGKRIKTLKPKKRKS